MKGGKTPLGYTIVEVMIVLAISGVMFLIAATFVNGRQEQASFTAGVHQMTANVQDVIEQVTDGQYSDIPLNCTYSSSGTTFPPGNSPGQGANSQCVFLGKMLYFTRPLPSSAYEVVSLAGGRDDTSGNPITDLSSAEPAIINDLTTNQVTPQSLNVDNITVNGGGTTTPAIGFFQSQGSVAAGGSLANGAQSAGLYYYSGSATDFPNLTFNGSDVQTAQSADICLTDGTRYAEITLGVSGGQLSANTQIDGITRPATC